ncbi:MAG: nucleotidyltransferase family protein [Geitlerinemataceae cyanobacterium]
MTATSAATKLQHHLAEILFATPDRARTIVTELTKNDDWPSLSNFAYERRVAPQLWQRLQQLEIALPDDARDRLGRLCRSIAVQSTTAAHRSVQVMQALAATKIDAVAFKGIGVMANLYAKPSDRMVGDVDVLVAPESLDGTIAALDAIGFKPKLPGELDDYVTYLEGRAREDNLVLVFEDKTGFEVDLHWGLKAIGGIEFPVADVLARKTTALLLGREIAVASPIDAMLLSVHHAVRDDLDPASALKDLADLSRWWQCSDRWAIAEVVHHARESGLLPPLVALWQILVSYGAIAPIHFTPLDIAPETLAQANGLRGLFELRLRGETLNRDLLHGLNWSIVKRFIRRRLHWNSAARFDKALWGIRDKRLNWSKVRRLVRTLRGLDRDTLNAYKALAKLQGR